MQLTENEAKLYPKISKRLDALYTQVDAKKLAVDAKNFAAEAITELQKAGFSPLDAKNILFSMHQYYYDSALNMDLPSETSNERMLTSAGVISAAIRNAAAQQQPKVRQQYSRPHSRAYDYNGMYR